MEVEVIKAKETIGNRSGDKRFERLRVAAYCRVSTDDEDQIKSYDSMVCYYTDLIANNAAWVSAGVYADKAITGTKDTRAEFQRLISDCMDGKIDMVIAKSIPRFARNTLDTLKYIRLLKEKNVAVYFEVEKINTLKDGEFLITILSSVAQQEVENTSAYVKKGLKMKMKRGEIVGFQACLGYDYDKVTKTLSINPEGAEVVKYIFERYVEGAGCTIIANELNKQGITTIKGNPWCTSSVMGIINNEKYKGDLLLGKTFTVDPISKRRLDNFGEEDRFYVKDHHEPIVSAEIFDKAQEIRKRRSEGRKITTPGKREKYSRQYAFSCMLECGFCGWHLARRNWHSSSKYKTTIWQCVQNTRHGKQACPECKGMPEEVIEKAFIESYRNITKNDKAVMDEFLRRVEKTLAEDSIEEQLKKLQKEKDNIQSRRNKLIDKVLDDLLDKESYQAADTPLKRKLSNVNAQMEMLGNQLEDKDNLSKRVKEFKKALSNNQVLEEFDRGVFESIVEKVIVGGYDENGERDPYKITFVYKTGFKDDIGNSKEKFATPRMNAKAKKMCTDVADKAKELCCQATSRVNELCTLASVDTCGELCTLVFEVMYKLYNVI